MNPKPHPADPPRVLTRACRAISCYRYPHDQRTRPRLDRKLHLGHRRRCAAHGRLRRTTSTDSPPTSRTSEFSLKDRLDNCLEFRQPDLGGIEGFLQREVMPWVPDAWYNQKTVKTGYEISFNRYFYKPKPMRTLEEIRAEIRAVEREEAGLLEGVLH